MGELVTSPPKGGDPDSAQWGSTVVLWSFDKRKCFTNLFHLSRTCFAHVCHSWVRLKGKTTGISRVRPLGYGEDTPWRRYAVAKDLG